MNNEVVRYAMLNWVLSRESAPPPTKKKSRAPKVNPRNAKREQLLDSLRDDPRGWLLKHKEELLAFWDDTMTADLQAICAPYKPTRLPYEYTDENGDLVKDFEVIRVLKEAFIEEGPAEIVECGPECKCGTCCPGRLCQFGTRWKFEMRKDPHKGWCVHTTRDIPKGAFVHEFLGDVLMSPQNNQDDETIEPDLENFLKEVSIWHVLEDPGYDRRYRSYIYACSTHHGNFEGYGWDNCIIDPSFSGSAARFFNHSCEPNLIIKHVYWDLDHETRLPHVCFFATKNIKEGEELTFDYMYDNPEHKIKCYCGSKKCKGYIMKTI